MLPIPIAKLPDSFDKKFLIRVHQSDKFLYRKFIPNLPIGLRYHRGVDHKGYDYFLPLAFDKEATAKAFMARLPYDFLDQMVVVKNIPKNIKCNCSSRF